MSDVKKNESPNGTVTTFISPFESSPVHCLKPRPCGKRRSPRKGGTTLILLQCAVNVQCFRNTCDNETESVPAIDVVLDLVGFSGRVREYRGNVLPDPCHQMIFEDTFDDLVENIRCNKLIDVGMWKYARERLNLRNGRIRIC